MDLTIRALTPEMAEDYLDFFDNRAFPDGSPFYPCYCNAFNLSADSIRRELFAKAQATGGAEGWKKALRDSAFRMVLDGSIQGYLAYVSSRSIGWCNANDRLSYYRVGEFSLDDVPQDAYPKDCPARGIIKSIVCFEISPAYRGMGIAGRLLERVLKDAAAAGYSIAEAYPTAGSDISLMFTGPKHMYEKAGFTEYGRADSTIIMRKALR